jgi:hypothetical protein
VPNANYADLTDMPGLAPGMFVASAVFPTAARVPIFEHDATATTMEATLKTILALSTIAVIGTFAAPAAALSGGPTQWGPMRPYPSSGWEVEERYVQPNVRRPAVARRPARHRARAHAGDNAAR